MEGGKNKCPLIVRGKKRETSCRLKTKKKGKKSQSHRPGEEAQKKRDHNKGRTEEMSDGQKDLVKKEHLGRGMVKGKGDHEDRQIT